LSYLTGWLSVLGWQAALVSTAYSGALAIQGLIALNTVNYAVPAWHGVLLTIGITLFTIIFNTVLLRRLPALEGGMLVVHIFGFIAIAVVLWVMGDRTDAGAVFTEFSDPQGWGSVSIPSKVGNSSVCWSFSFLQYGVAMLVGSLSATGSTIASDSSVHLSEELQEAAWVLPRSMVTSAAVNYTLAFLMLISKSRNAGLEKEYTTLTMSTRQPSLLPKVETSNSSLQPHTFNRMYKS
jgi:choline transport protein